MKKKTKSIMLVLKKIKQKIYDPIKIYDFLSYNLEGDTG